MARRKGNHLGGNNVIDVRIQSSTSEWDDVEVARTIWNIIAGQPNENTIQVMMGERGMVWKRTIAAKKDNVRHIWEKSTESSRS